ncbi:acyltransferase family protein [Pseudomonas rustica]|uniref:acyltransferase family protein n=1 Tax=Pseudomonas rustica TaxID=2827099 RepID=UPI003CECD289
MNFRSDINGLRAWAVVVVVLYHFGISFFNGGFAGVDIFFVISGFLMTGIITRILEDKSGKAVSSQITSFFLARVRRISPALIAVCIVLLVLGWFYSNPAEFELLAKQSLSAVLFYSNILFFDQAGYFDVASGKKLLLHTWSLSVEWQFYVVLPFFMLAAWKLKSTRASLFVALVLAFLISLAYSVFESFKAPDAAFYLLSSRAWELVLGGMIFFISCNFSIEGKKAKLVERVSFVTLIGVVLFFDSTLPWPGLYALVPTVATALIILSNQSDSKWTSGKVAQWLGDRSYSLYLWHWPISIYVKNLEGGHPHWYTVAGLVATLIVGHLSYRYIEGPARKHFFKGNAKRSLVASFGVTASVLACSVVITANAGYPSRYPAGVAELTKYHFNMADWRDGTCFLRPEQNFKDFNGCSSHSDSVIHTSALLWGDSHAAQLYPGLVKTLPHNVEFTQLTASACPPFLDVELSNRPNCKKINDYVRDWIITNKPDQVILSARWPGYDWSPVSKTIEFLQSNGVKKIQIFGPVPSWSEYLPDLLVKSVGKSEAANAQIPERLAVGFSDYVSVVDGQLHAVAEKNHVSYISSSSIFCDKSGCMTTITDEHGLSPTAYDDAHLSVSGSEYLITKSSVWK